MESTYIARIASNVTQAALVSYNENSSGVRVHSIKHIRSECAVGKQDLTELALWRYIFAVKFVHTIGVASCIYVRLKTGHAHVQDSSNHTILGKFAETARKGQRSRVATGTTKHATLERLEGVRRELGTVKGLTARYNVLEKETENGQHSKSAVGELDS